MTKLLKKYYSIQKEYRKNKVLKQYPDLETWSVALNKELANVLSRMDIDELNYLLETTSGMMKSIIRKYIYHKTLN